MAEAGYCPKIYYIFIKCFLNWDIIYFQSFSGYHTRKELLLEDWGSKYSNLLFSLILQLLLLTFLDFFSSPDFVALRYLTLRVICAFIPYCLQGFSEESPLWVPTHFGTSIGPVCKSVLCIFNIPLHTYTVAQPVCSWSILLP